MQASLVSQVVAGALVGAAALAPASTAAHMAALATAAFVAQVVPQSPAPRVTISNVEGRGSYRSIVHSFRQWEGQDRSITTETVECDVAAMFRGAGDATVNGTISFVRETRRDGKVIGRTEIRGEGNPTTNHHLRLGSVPGNPGTMSWARWTPSALEVPVDISVGDNAPVGHTLYCETWLRRTNELHPLTGQYSGPLTTVDVMIKPSPITKPSGRVITVQQTVTLAWDFAPL